jgi:hypothetical protein
MFRNILIPAIVLTLLFGACRPKTEEPEKLLSFDPADSVLVDLLMRFYLDSNIIPREALICEHAEGGLYTFDCLSENCFISQDYMQDSTSGVFFTEVSFETGSSGNNNIYICHRDADGFRILFSTEGQTDSYLGPDTLINGYKVLYLIREDQTLRLYHNGTEFVTEEFTAPAVSEEELLTSN